MVSHNNLPCNLYRRRGFSFFEWRIRNLIQQPIFSPHLLKSPIQTPGHQPQGFAANAMASSRLVRRVYAELFLYPLYPTLFFGMGIGLRVNSEDAPYSAQGVSFALE